MPLVSFAGTDIKDLQGAIATVEAFKTSVKQVVGNYDDRWYLLVDPPQGRDELAGQMETR